MIKVGDIILYRSLCDKDRPEIAVVTGWNPDSGRLTRREVPGVGSLLFEGASFTGDAEPHLVMKLGCGHCTLRGGCVDYHMNDREELCGKFFEHLGEHGLGELIKELPVE